MEAGKIFTPSSFYNACTKMQGFFFYSLLTPVMSQRALLEPPCPARCWFYTFKTLQTHRRFHKASGFVGCFFWQHWKKTFLCVFCCRLQTQGLTYCFLSRHWLFYPSIHFQYKLLPELRAVGDIRIFNGKNNFARMVRWDLDGKPKVQTRHETLNRLLDKLTSSFLEMSLSR